jgi:multiple sugar transport system substrate-binding protein
MGKRSWRLMAISLLLAVVLILPVAAQDKPVKLKIFTHFGGAWNDLVTKNTAAFTKLNPKVTFDYQYVGDADFYTKILVLFASGEVPDVTRIFTNNLYDFVSNGWLDKAPADVVQDLNDNFVPEIKPGVAVGNTIYGYAAEAILVKPLINVKLFADAGVKIPTTWAELTTVQEKLTKRNADGTTKQVGVALSTSDIWVTIHFCPFLWARGGEFLNKDFTKAAFNTPAGVAALKDYKKLAPMDIDWGNNWIQGTVGLIFCGPYLRDSIRTQAAPDFNYKAIPMLKGDNGKQVGTQYFWTWVVANKIPAENKRAAWDFLKFMNNRPNMNEMVRISDYPLVRKDLISQFKDDSWLSSFAADWPTGKDIGSPKHFTEVYHLLSDNVGAYLSNQTTAEEALKNAETAINELLAKK